MNKRLLHKDSQLFINQNLNNDYSKIALSGSPFPDISIQEILEQIQSKNKAEKKLPTWFKTENIYYPSKVSIEQTSSEITAKYKARIVSGKTLADLTGGLGVDSFYFSKKFKKVFHFEINPELSEIADHNFKQFNATINCINKEGITAIKNEYFNVIYIDPSRRNDAKGKVFYLKDCLPNVTEHLDYLLKRCDTLMIKTSPMLDISAGIKELRQVNEIHIIAVNNEVKELLWIINSKESIPCTIKTINLKKEALEQFSFLIDETAIATYSLPETFLYEPNAAILKSGAFYLISKKFQLNKLHQHTHLYTSNTLIDFPGRRFAIEKIIPYQKKEIKNLLFETKANIAIRNFPLKPEELKNLYKITDGGDNYLFFTTLLNDKKAVLICKKQKSP